MPPLGTPTLADAVGPHSLTAADQLLAGETVQRFVAEAGAATLVAANAVATASGPSTGPRVAELAGRVDAVDLSSPLGSTEAALAEAADLYLRDAVYFHHPGYMAHLNCPVAIPAVAAEALVTSVNSSLDTWDQSAGATLIERRLVEWTAGLIGFPGAGPAAVDGDRPGARAGTGAGTSPDGIFTSGGTQSNLQAMLIARNHAVAGRPGPLPSRLADLRIYASTESHFSIANAAAMLGLGKDAVVPVATDAAHRLDADALAARLAEGAAAGTRPMAIVATAGTTDFGAIDPLPGLRRLADRYGAWFHVDAAYGCGLLVSPGHRGLLDGIEHADSVTVDFHKSFFQPIGSSALLLRDGGLFGHVTHYADYLNPAAQAGTVPNQVDKSLQTTRRFDALKLWVTLRSMGADAIGAMFDELIDLATAAGDSVRRHPDLELAAEVQLSTVVFRYVPRHAKLDSARLDALQDAIRAELYASGRAMVAATTVRGATATASAAAGTEAAAGHGARHLKLTLLNPRTTLADVEQVLAAVVRHGERLLATGVPHQPVPSQPVPSQPTPGEPAASEPARAEGGAR
ncbi:pyridoxal-dependent decarboxylase [Zhihengliuella sp.]|uniref:pyridoxal phosphate-dependent decarboxylase family protein n=1 Tax=Zhihengliuella sp. TaxID=1954483 RepID=UPI002811DDCA|nr:pyridoxal-dependent decarboxylase [Zhihengliuella sp.]